MMLAELARRGCIAPDYLAAAGIDPLSLPARLDAGAEIVDATAVADLYWRRLTRERFGAADWPDVRLHARRVWIECTLPRLSHSDEVGSMAYLGPLRRFGTLHERHEIGEELPPGPIGGALAALIKRAGRKARHVVEALAYVESPQGLMGPVAVYFYVLDVNGRIIADRHGALCDSIARQPDPGVLRNIGPLFWPALGTFNLINSGGAALRRCEPSTVELLEAHRRRQPLPRPYSVIELAPPARGAA